MNIGLLIHDSLERNKIAESLFAMNHQVIVYDSSTAAQGDILSAHHNGQDLPVSLLILELSQPNEISGLELVDRLRQHVQHTLLDFVLLCGDDVASKHLALGYHLDVPLMHAPLSSPLTMFKSLKERKSAIHGPQH